MNKKIISSPATILNNELLYLKQSSIKLIDVREPSPEEEEPATNAQLTFNDIFFNYKSFLAKLPENSKDRFYVLIDALDVRALGTTSPFIIHDNFVIKELLFLVEKEKNNTGFRNFYIKKALGCLEKPESKGDLFAGAIALACLPLKKKDKPLKRIISAVLNCLEQTGFQNQLAAGAFLLNQNKEIYQDQLGALLKTIARFKAQYNAFKEVNFFNMAQRFDLLSSYMENLEKNIGGR